MALELHVYPTDAEAFEASAALAGERLRAAGAGRLSVGLSGGRGGRGVMVALAALSDLPWDRIDWFWCDDRCVPESDPRSNVRVARDSLLGPRDIPAERIHPPPTGRGDETAVAAAYAAQIAALVAGTPTPVFDLLLLGMGRDGHVASLMPGSSALAATAPVAPVPVAEVREEPIVARITLTPPVLAAARHLVVTVAGDAKAAPLAAVMRDPADVQRLPAQLVRPSARITWVVDRPAASVILQAARAG